MKNDEDTPCDICRTKESEPSNEMVFCEFCDVCVHQACYGITKIPSGDWFCKPCQENIRPNCIFCPEKKGALKKAENGSWAHVSCALWIPEVSFSEPETMDNIANIESIPKSRWSLNCSLCTTRSGACIQCYVKKCKTAYHVTCAFKKNLHMEMEDVETNEQEIKFESFCLVHTQMQSNGEDPHKNTGSSRKRKKVPESPTEQPDSPGKFKNIFNILKEYIKTEDHLNGASTSSGNMSPDTLKKKSHEFFNKLMRLADTENTKIASFVNKLIQNLIDRTIEPDEFLTRMQKELHSNPAPNLASFLNASLDLLRESLIKGEIRIEGISLPVSMKIPVPTTQGAAGFNNPCVSFTEAIIENGNRAQTVELGNKSVPGIQTVSSFPKPSKATARKSFPAPPRKRSLDQILPKLITKGVSKTSQISAQNGPSKPKKPRKSAPTRNSNMSPKKQRKNANLGRQPSPKKSARSNLPLPFQSPQTQVSSLANQNEQEQASTSASYNEQRQASPSETQASSSATQVLSSASHNEQNPASSSTSHNEQNLTLSSAHHNQQLHGQRPRMVGAIQESNLDEFLGYLASLIRPLPEHRALKLQRKIINFVYRERQVSSDNSSVSSISSID